MPCATQENRLQRHLAEKFGVSVLISKTVRNTGKNQLQSCSASSIYYKKHLAHKNDTNEKHKTHICLIALNKTALARNEAHLSVMLKMVSFSNNTHLDTGLHIVQHGRWRAGTSICNTVSKFLQCWWRGCIQICI